LNMRPRPPSNRVLNATLRYAVMLGYVAGALPLATAPASAHVADDLRCEAAVAVEFARVVGGLPRLPHVGGGHRNVLPSEPPHDLQDVRLRDPVAPSNGALRLTLVPV